MNPVLRADVLPKDSATFANVAALSRYFGGEPRSSESAPLKVRRRGC